MVISNRAKQVSLIKALFAAVALHNKDSTVRLQTAYKLNLRPGEAKILDDLPPATTAVVAGEDVMRLLAGEQPSFIEAYAKIEGTVKEPLGTIEFGIVEADDLDEPVAKHEKRQTLRYPHEFTLIPMSRCNT
jgi:hypothetical protein